MSAVSETEGDVEWPSPDDVHLSDIETSPAGVTAVLHVRGERARRVSSSWELLRVAAEQSGPPGTLYAALLLQCRAHARVTLAVATAARDPRADTGEMGGWRYEDALLVGPVRARREDAIIDGSVLRRQHQDDVERYTIPFGRPVWVDPSEVSAVPTLGRALGEQS